MNLKEVPRVVILSPIERGWVDTGESSKKDRGVQSPPSGDPS